MTIDLLFFAQRPTCAWLQPAYLEQPPALAYHLTHGTQPSRVYYSPAMDAAWTNLALDTLKDYESLKHEMPASSGTGWAVREANSYQVLRLKKTQAYLDRLAREGPRSPLLSWAGISTVVTRKTGGVPSEESNIEVTLPNAEPPLFLADPKISGHIIPKAYRPGFVQAQVWI